MTELPSGTVTFLFTDIERSTESAAALGDERWADALQTHRELLRPAFEKHGGVEVGTEGDSFFVAFARAGDAVEAAVDGQRALGSHQWTGEARIRVRMGLHTGEALVRGGGYIGHDVHRAKRVCDAANGGQILLSQTTADLVRSAQALTDLGPHRFKDLGEPQQIYQVGDATFPPVRSLESFRNTLPPQRSSFIGREREIAELRELLNDNRLVTIHGVGGCGKTRLAVQVGAEVLHEFPDGVFFTDLAPVADADAIPHVVGDAIGLPVGTGPIGGVQTEADEDLVLRYIADRRCLVILDNCEHLLDACASLADRMLARCPKVSILATSREALQLEGEQAWRLPSLSVPDDDQHLADSEAVSLFAARARAANTGFELTPSNATAIAEICRRPDGIPLAIEFAAARVTHLSPKQIAQKLDDRFRLLTGGRRQVQRQLTLQAALDWSYDLLEEPERILLRRLAVFPADFSLEAAEGICSDEQLDGDEIFELLGSLVAKSLVGAESAGDVIRYRLLETVRAYAADRLALAGEARTLRDRHRDWHLEWLETASWESIGYGLVRPLLRESVNLRAATEWSSSEGRLDLVARMAPRLMMVAGVAGLTPDLRRWCDEVIDADMTLDRGTRAACLLASITSTPWGGERASRLQEVLEMGDEIPAPIRAMTLSQQGIAFGIMGAFARDDVLVERSRQHLRDALALAADLQPDFRLAIEVMDGMNELDLANVNGAVKALERAMKTQAHLPDLSSDAGLLAVSFYLGTALYAAGEYERAGRLMVQTREAAENISTGIFDGAGFLGAGAAALSVADRPGTVELLKNSLRDVRRSHVRLALEEWVSGAAGVLALAGDHERAAQLLSWVRTRTLERGIASGNPGTYVVDIHNVRLVRDALGPEEAMRCREAGRLLAEDEAVAMALEGLDAL